MIWVRKTINELATESSERYKKVRFIYYFIQLASLYFVANDFAKYESIIFIIKTDPERITLLLLPIFVYFSYKNYVKTGSTLMRQGRMCLFCKDGMGFSDDGWGFKRYGNKKPKWYQFKACKQSDKCDIAFMYQVKLINNDTEV